MKATGTWLDSDQQIFTRWTQEMVPNGISLKLTAPDGEECSVDVPDVKGPSVMAACEAFRNMYYERQADKETGTPQWRTGDAADGDGSTEAGAAAPSISTATQASQKAVAALASPQEVIAASLTGLRLRFRVIDSQIVALGIEKVKVHKEIAQLELVLEVFNAPQDGDTERQSLSGTEEERTRKSLGEGTSSPIILPKGESGAQEGSGETDEG